MNWINRDGARTASAVIGIASGIVAIVAGLAALIGFWTFPVVIMAIWLFVAVSESRDA